MMDEYGSSGASTFRTWQVFGDASLQVRTAAPQAMTVTYPQSITPGTTQIVVSTGVPNALVGISRNSMYVTSAYTSLSGIVTITCPSGYIRQSYDLVVTGSNRITYQGGFVVGGADPVRDITISISDGLACLRWSAYPGAIRLNIYGAAERGDEFSLVCTGPDTMPPYPSPQTPISFSNRSPLRMMRRLALLTALGLLSAAFAADLFDLPHEPAPWEVNATSSAPLPSQTPHRRAAPVAEWEPARGALVRYQSGLGIPGRWRRSWPRMTS
jgi:hypothetical protein